jgi:hypothetical protein
VINETSTNALHNQVRAVGSNTAVRHYSIQIVLVHLKNEDTGEQDSVVNEYSVV